MNKDRIEMAYYSYVRVENKMYFSHIFFNGLFEMNLDDFSVKFICRFPEVDAREFCLHGMGQAVEYKNRIYFFPLNCRFIHSYDIEGGDIKGILLPMETPIETDRYFLGAYKWINKDKVWLFSRILSKGVFIFDLNSQDIQRDDILTNSLAKYQTITNFIETPNGKLYTCSLPDNILIEVKVDERQVKEYPIPIGSVKISSINYRKEAFVFADKYTGGVYEWKLGDKCAHIFMADKEERMSLKEAPFSLCCYGNNEMYIFPSRDKNIMKIASDSGLVKKAADYPEDFYFTNKWDEIAQFPAFGACEIMGDEIWLHPCIGNKLLIFNTKSNYIIGKELSIDISEVFPYEGQHYESQKISLESFCHRIKKTGIDSQSMEIFEGEKAYLR